MALPLRPGSRQMRTLSLLFALSSLVSGSACGESKRSDADDAGHQTDAGNKPDAGELDPNCTKPLALPFTSRLIEGVPAAEDFAFDAEGYLVTLEGGHSLVRVERDKPLELLTPNVVVRGRGLRVRANGETLIADQDRSLVVAVDTKGGTRKVTTQVANPNGLALGPNGQAYVSDFGITGEVFRLDPKTGKTTLLASPGKGSNGLAFSPDYHTLYIGDHDLGVIHRLEMADDGSVTKPELFAEGLVRPDGLTTDSCGTLYAASFGGKLYVVSPEGDVQVAAEFDGAVSAVNFGSGARGFDRRKLYVTAISKGGVYELDVDRQAPPAPP
jgi:hypothetical protein